MEEFDYDIGSPFDEGWIKNIWMLVWPTKVGFWNWRACKDSMKTAR
jgi:hypothetical protein